MKAPTDDVMPTHALMALWDAQLSRRPDEFSLIISGIDKADLVGGSLIAVTYTCSRWAESSVEATYNVMEIGRACMRVARGWASEADHSPLVTDAVRDYALSLIMAPGNTGDGVQLNFKMDAEYGSYETAIAALTPMNIMAQTAVVSGKHPDGGAYRAWLRDAFWRMQLGEPLP